MRFFNKIFSFAKYEPFGCLFSAVLSVSIICALAAGFSFVIYSIWAVTLVKNNIESATGFGVTTQNIYVNVFTGYCEITEMHISNPEVYDMRELADKNADNSLKFLNIKKINAKLSPLELIKGRFELSSFSADITLLNCVRLNNSTSNLPEFIVNMLKIVSVKKENGKPTLSLFDLKIKNAQYTDYSTSRDTISWKMNMDFDFKRTDVSDFKKMLKEIRAAFEKENAPFVSNGLSILSNDIL